LFHQVLRLGKLFVIEGRVVPYTVPRLARLLFRQQMSPEYNAGTRG